jgi:hypothetical protein
VNICFWAKEQKKRKGENVNDKRKTYEFSTKSSADRTINRAFINKIKLL